MRILPYLSEKEAIPRQGKKQEGAEVCSSQVAKEASQGCALCGAFENDVARGAFFKA
jgi:hypothetical protein